MKEKVEYVYSPCQNEALLKVVETQLLTMLESSDFSEEQGEMLLDVLTKTVERAQGKHLAENREIRFVYFSCLRSFLPQKKIMIRIDAYDQDWIYCAKDHGHLWDIGFKNVFPLETDAIKELRRRAEWQYDSIICSIAESIFNKLVMHIKDRSVSITSYLVQKHQIEPVLIIGEYLDHSCIIAGKQNKGNENVFYLYSRQQKYLDEKIIKKCHLRRKQVQGGRK